MDSATFDELQQTLKTEGAGTALDRLCTTLRERKDYGNLFYALLLKKRHELGVSPSYVEHLAEKARGDRRQPARSRQPTPRCREAEDR